MTVRIFTSKTTLYEIHIHRVISTYLYTIRGESSATGKYINNHVTCLEIKCRLFLSHLYILYYTKSCINIYLISQVQSYLLLFFESIK